MPLQTPPPSPPATHSPHTCRTAHLAPPTTSPRCASVPYRILSEGHRQSSVGSIEIRSDVEVMQSRPSDGAALVVPTVARPKEIMGDGPPSLVLLSTAGVKKLEQPDIQVMFHRPTARDSARDSTEKQKGGSACTPLRRGTETEVCLDFALIAASPTKRVATLPSIVDKATFRHLAHLQICRRRSKPRISDQTRTEASSNSRRERVGVSASGPMSSSAL